MSPERQRPITTRLPGTPEATRAWLAGDPPLDQLQEAFPAQWTAVQHELADVVRQGDLEQVKAYVGSLAKRRGPPVLRALAARARTRS